MLAPVTRPGLALTAICLGFLMITLDATIVNVALPAIRSDLGGTLEGLQWVVDSYTIALAALLLTAGAGSDQAGARRAFQLGLVVFALSSAACALAPGQAVLVAARAVQGVGAAVLLPASLALIVHQFPDARRRAHALGIWGGMSGLGLAAGPVLGGFAVDLVGWRTIFLVNLPVTVLAVLLTRWTVAEAPRQRQVGVDLAGQLLSVAALGCLAAGMIEAGQRGWTSPVVLGLLAVGVCAAIGFVLVEANASAPMLPLGVFRNRAFSAASAIGFLFNFCLYGTLFVLSLYLQQSLHLVPWAAGLALLPLTLAVGTNAFLAGRVVARLGTRAPMVAGGIAGALGSAVLATLDVHGPLAVLLVGSVLFGCCSLAMPAMTATAMSSLGPAQAGLGSGVLNAARQTGGALGVALLGSLLGGAQDLIAPRASMVLVALAFSAIVLLAVAGTRSRSRS
ncbi:MFS transporter [Kutzneria viridogrisea]|uniref:Major facilitator superfamily (MFS) profile domain-containing protein n=1 Tax=Kutzneria albida DSM 43870 TaxID=1449976 RepID=W5WFC2_9PSEU|nr:DHA2 family efflux MFS transporter permease subunit [Kutzneria albida]AHH99281.1 hypothetical protein KALB_5920 [Kutzneria albida DSM 43870]